MPKRAAQGTRVPAKEQKEEATPKATAGGVKKLPLTERVKKFLAEVSDEVSNNVFEMVERVVEDSEKNRNNVCFVVFSDGSEEETVDEESNIRLIKDVLFHYHTEKDLKTSKPLMASILAPETEEDTHVLLLQELSV